ncbi:N-acetylglucosamine-6-phosphate deacetylase [Thorsellia kenyensis]|uniref:N-acetylglucosamine-6-phosphate deacetylase n=1 Tax=Thorsellia kenyensis TaxID=1549888 RepID=A0ABV6CBK7_9GAMM
MFALINAKIYTGDSLHNTPFLENKAILVNGNKIDAIIDKENLPKDIETFDLKGLNLAPGLIDLQLNGCGGVQFNDNFDSVSAKTLAVMQASNEKYGCTSFLPTLITSNDALIKHAVITMRDYLENSQNTHQALGLHIEGPYLSVHKKGTHNAKLIRKINTEMLEFLCENADVIKMLTLAPEEVDDNAIKRLSDAGIVVSAGHSNSLYERAKESFSAGISFSTHLFNAMPYITGREPGLVGAILDTPQVYAGIIADGHHIAWSNIRLAKSLKQDKLILVTDATAPAGTELDTFFFAGKTIYHKDGACLDENGTLSGSAATLIKCVENCVNKVGFSLDEAIRMATLYPARSIKVDHLLGSIAVGKIANLMAFDDKFEIKACFVNGRLTHKIS